MDPPSSSWSNAQEAMAYFDCYLAGTDDPVNHRVVSGYEASNQLDGFVPSQIQQGQNVLALKASQLHSEAGPPTDSGYGTDTFSVVSTGLPANGRASAIKDTRHEFYIDDVSRPFFMNPMPTDMAVLQWNLLANDPFRLGRPSARNGQPQGNITETSQKYSCVQCEFKSRTNAELTKHVNRHLRPFTCDVPGCHESSKSKGFGTKNDLNRHMKSCHKELHLDKSGYYQCPICSDNDKQPSKKWPRKDNFRNHLRNLHGFSNELKDMKLYFVPGHAVLERDNKLPDNVLAGIGQDSREDWYSDLDDLPFLGTESATLATTSDGKPYCYPDNIEVHENSELGNCDTTPAMETVVDNPQSAAKDTSNYEHALARDKILGNSLGNTNTDYAAAPGPSFLEDVVDMPIPENSWEQFETRSSCSDALGVAALQISSSSDKGQRIDDQDHDADTEPNARVPAICEQQQRGDSASHDETTEEGNDRHVHHPTGNDDSLDCVMKYDNDPGDGPELPIDLTQTETQPTEPTASEIPSDDQSTCALPDNISLADLLPQLKQVIDKERFTVPDVISLIKHVIGKGQITASDLTSALQISSQPSPTTPKPASVLVEVDDVEREKTPDLNVPKNVPKKTPKSALKDGEKRTHVCTLDKCNKPFHTMAALRKHQRRHARPYRCTFQKCEKLFGSKSDWRRHEVTQHYDLEWKCPGPKTEKPGTCTRRFLSHDGVSDHLRDHGYSDDETKKLLDECDQTWSKHDRSRFWCGFCKEHQKVNSGDSSFIAARFDHVDCHFMEQYNAKGAAPDWLAEPLDPAKKVKAATDWQCCSCHLVSSGNFRVCEKCSEHLRCIGCKMVYAKGAAPDWLAEPLDPATKSLPKRQGDEQGSGQRKKAKAATDWQCCSCHLVSSGNFRVCEKCSEHHRCLGCSKA